jgi:hypothetical protein
MLRVPISTLALLVGILVATRSVHCIRGASTHYPSPNTRQIETFDFGVPNLDLWVGIDRALKFFDQICNQPHNSDSEVSGAYNPLTNEFMTWTDYLATAGKYSSPEVFYAAHGPWHTFRGECFWAPYNTCVETGPWTQSWHYSNKKHGRSQSRWIKFDYDDPGFEARTSVPSWVEKCADRQNIATLLEKLNIGLETVITVWEALRHPEPQTVKFAEKVQVRGCSEYYMTVSRVFRTVRANRVFFVAGWFYIDNNGHGREGKGWMDFGMEFVHVQSLSAWIEGIGLQRQGPEPESYLKVVHHDVDLPPESCT